MGSKGSKTIARPSLLNARSPVNDFAKMLVEIAEKWQKLWSKNKVFEADPDPSRPKFFITAAFPYPNSPMHIGHGRTYTITDVYARFKRMQGYNVLFPMGFHYTGTPILTMAEALAKNDEELIDLMVNVYDVPPGDLEKLKTPLGMARYFHEDAKKAMIEMGYSIDWRREFTTIDKEFNKFIEWQFKKLKDKGLIVKGTHPVGWCPNHNMPVGMHDTKGDVEPEIGEFTILLFQLEDSDIYLAAATLRPETVFGAVNIWLNPSTRYVVVETDKGKKWLVSEKALFKLQFQMKRVRKISEINPQEMIGKRVINPATGKKVPILPAEFVDPDTATGVVMSVPAHAPYDYIALEDLRKNGLLVKLGISEEEITPIPVIEVKGYSDIPARDVVVRLGISSQQEKDLLDEATKTVYGDEYRHGFMRRDLDELIDESFFGDSAKYIRAVLRAWIVGRSVPEAREETIKWLSALGLADKMYEIMNRPVYCRCGTEIVVKVLQDQWFINYSDAEWKKRAYEALDNMKIVPEVMREEFKKTIDWLKLRAAARTRGLGTRLPWSKEWIIESLSDSTIYMAFYTVIHHIRNAGLDPEKLTPSFWDYVMLGKGKPEDVSRETGVSIELLERLRKEFDYWYPLDSRHSAKDLVPNHLTFFIFNHVAIYPKDKWPRQIVVNGFVKLEGKKMSKSLRNVIPLRRILRVYGPDTVRATLLAAAELLQDADFTDELARSILSRIQEYYEIAKTLSNNSESCVNDGIAGKWLMSITQEYIEDVTKAMEELRLRHATVKLLYEFPKEIKKYMNLGGSFNGCGLREAVRVWTLMLAPITPHITEEVWKMIGNKGFASLSPWPSPDKKRRDSKVELMVRYADMVITDIESILSVVGKKPSRIVIAVSKPDYWWIARKVAEAVELRRQLREVMREVMGGVAKENKSRVSKIVNRLYEYMTGLDEYTRRLILQVEEFDEKIVLEQLKKYVMEAVAAEELTIIYVDDKEARSLPKQKIEAVIPFKPAIQVY